MAASFPTCENGLRNSIRYRSMKGPEYMEVHCRVSPITKTIFYSLFSIPIFNFCHRSLTRTMLSWVRTHVKPRSRTAWNVSNRTLPSLSSARCRYSLPSLSAPNDTCQSRRAPQKRLIPASRSTPSDARTLRVPFFRSWCHKNQPVFEKFLSFTAANINDDG